MNSFTENRKSKIENLLSRIQRPTRYLGREINAVFKSPGDVTLRAALLFPDLYEVGMSHLGLSLLYAILNREEDIWAERAYAPAPDLEAELRVRRQPLTSLESGTPLSRFDLLGVSFQYELGYTNFLNMLELGGVPLLAAERTSEDPVVIGGGPACFNPEPLSPFLDAAVLGDGEEAVLEVARVVQAWRAARGTRGELWQALEEVEGVYVPGFFRMEFDESGFLREILPTGRRGVIHKRVLDDLNRFGPSPHALVPFCQIIHDRLSVEVSRGCTRGCRYCQAGMLYRPVRERDPQAVLAHVEEALAATGYEEASLLSLSVGDYGPLAPLLEELMNRLSQERVAMSLPSLRADTLTPEMMAQIKRVRRTGLTLAPEAGSPRLRKVINKNLTEDEIMAAAARAFGAGWNLLKLYFMIGLPRETGEDLEAIAGLTNKILQAGPRGRAKLNVSLSTFIPKSHTPFQWERQEGLEASRARLYEVKDRLRRPQVQAKWNSAAQSWLEGVFSRGDRRLAEVLMAAHLRGCRLDAWSEELRLDMWRQAFQDSGVDPDFYLRERRLDEPLPWDHLNCRVSREFLVTERDRAYQGLETPDCRQEGCQDCGVCDGGRVALKLHDSQTTLKTRLETVAPAPAPTVWYRLTYCKLDEAKWLSHLELVAAVYRALRRTGLPLVFTAGFHPLPRVSFHRALPVGMQSLGETMDVELAAAMGACGLVEVLNRAMPPGLKILSAARLPKRLPPPRVKSATYQVESPEPVFSPEAALRFLSQEEFPVTRKRPKEERTVDLRPQVARLEFLDPHEVQLEMLLAEKDNLKPADALAAIFGLDQGQAQDLEILKVKSS
ncbi:MAG: TIGR03960 family B12-binding radical SAM protein [Deltaproteobacteria bacterium]|nr:TIGR03960 family B12-binding radical SAM protein [Deltaproteobacteria bacterium]